MKTLMAVLLLCVLSAHGKQSLYIDTHLSNSHPLKRELIEKLKQSGTVMIVTLPDKADLILDLEQTGRSLGMCAGGILFSSACGHRGRVVLKSRQTGEELWSEEKGGAWQWSGWSAGTVGRKLGEDVVRFLIMYAPASANPATEPVVTSEASRAPEAAPRTSAPPVTPKPKDSAEKPGSKCTQGTYWGVNPIGDPICVWSH
jgi:hypothetical protein